jgi:thymidine kinase
VEFSENAAHAGKIVLTSALSGTYLKEPFNKILDLVPKAEKIVHLQAICKICSHTAGFTLRTSSSTETELVGGGEDYMPVCRECYNFMNKENKQ